MRGALLLACAACNLDSRLAPDAAIDAAVDAAVDAPPPRCDRAKPFGAPTLVAELTVPPPNDSFGARLSADELTVVFSRNISIPEAIGVMVATRPNPTAPFGTPIEIAEVNTSTDDSNPMVDSSGLHIYLDSTRAPAAVGGLDIYVATRSTPTGTFGTPQGVLAVDTTEDETEPYVVNGGSAMFFARKSAGFTDIYESRGGPSSFATPAAHNELNLAPFNDDHPVLSEDGLTIYFASDRTNMGQMRDIYRSTRTSATAAFGSPTMVSGLTTAAEDVPTWVSNDDCVLLFSTQRMPAGQGIFQARRPM
jgi:hypothetical protein